VYDRWLGPLIVLCALQPSAFGAQSSEDDEGPKAWKELELKLPPYPKPGNLIEFEGGAASTNRFFIDTESISVGSDGVVRYTLVTKAAGGAENISYEGIRCDMQQQKYYAFGRRDETWSNARRSEWRRIEYKDLNRQHGVLFANYFCYDRTLIKSRAEAIQRFKYGPPTRGRNNE
jgi:hypothetical protein